MLLGKFAGRHGLSHENHEIEVFPADFPFDSLRRIWDPLDHSVLASSAKFWRLRAWPGSWLCAWTGLMWRCQCEISWHINDGFIVGFSGMIMCAYVCGIIII
jgi:hypothetical protein